MQAKFIKKFALSQNFRIFGCCGEIRSAPFATTVRRITSASCARRFADFAQQADLLNPKNGSKLPSRDFANPPNR